MKKFIFTLPLIISTFILTSCLGLAKEPDQITRTYEALVTVSSVGDYPSFLMDDGYTLYCTDKITSDSTAYLTIGERYYLRYSLDDTTNHVAKRYPVKLQSMNKASKKNIVILPKDSLDIYSNQGLESVYTFYVGGNYLNMIFNTYTSMDKTDTYEIVRMMKSEVNTAQDTFPNISLELRHNVSALSIAIYNTRMASVDLSPLVAEFPKAKKFNLNIKWSLYSASEPSSMNLLYRPYNLSSGEMSLAKQLSGKMSSNKVESVPPLGL